MVEKLKIQGGPGCGKTFNLMQKYREFINSGFRATDITLVTFRKSSASDLIKAVNLRFPNLDEKMLKKHVGTIHSICWRLGGYLEPLNTKDICNFVKEYKYTQYLKPDSVDDEEEQAFSGNLFDLYTWLRNTQTKPENWFKYPGAENILLPSHRVIKFLQDYEEYKMKIGKIDYSDMIQEVLNNRIPLDTPILMIDEFQDLTAQMYKLFEMWVNDCDIVVIAGDPFQSIYGFWGGSPKYFSAWDAPENVINETKRLPEQINLFARRILKFEGMNAPDIKAKKGYIAPIKTLHFNDTLPEHSTELHLVRCNYQSIALARNLATQGKLFSGLYGWTEEEIKIANAVLTYRKGKNLSKEDIKSLVTAFPLKWYGNTTHEDLLKSIDRNYTISNNRKNLSLLKPQILDALLDIDPTAKMKKSNKLFSSKLMGVLNRKTLITLQDCEYKKLLTIHGSKGLEADAVFLHTGITPRINHSIVIPGEDSAAEARVWYVGVTRPREVLYIVKDEGKNYPLTEMCPAC